MDNKEKLLSYYRTKYKDYFSPSMLDFHLNRLYDEAKKTFDPSKSDFKTHLATHMQRMSRIAIYKGSLLKKTEYGKDMMNRIMNAYNKIKTVEMKEPTPEEIAKATGIPLKKVEETLRNNVHAAIVPGVETSKLYIDADIISGISNEEKKVLDTIVKNMPPEKAYKHTGLNKTKYYQIRNSIREKLRKAYLNTLRDNNVIGGN